MAPMVNIRKVQKQTPSLKSLVRALRPHEPRLQLAAALETGDPQRARRLTAYVLRQSARRRGAKGLQENPARKLHRDMKTLVAQLKANGALA